MLTWLASLLGGPIVNGLINAYKAKLEAANTRDAQAADLAKKEIEGEIAARQVEASILRQEQGWWVTAMIRPLFAAPFIIWVWKVVVWDKVLGLGTTDPLTGTIGEWGGYIILSYFAGRTIEKSVKIFKAK